MRMRALLTGAALCCAAAHGAYASVYVLNFAGLDGNLTEGVGDYYNGGAGSLGSGPGPNDGIAFSSNALTCSGQPTGACNTAQIPGGPGANALFFLGGGAAIMDVAAGFTTDFSFYYSAAYTPDVVDIWSGVDDSGTLLATVDLPTTPDDGAPNCFATDFCPYEAISVTFLGIAKSVDFGTAFGQVGFADLTVGSDGGDAAPEPASWALMLIGVTGVGGAARRVRGPKAAVAV